jgi:hypothetical protein
MMANKDRRVNRSDTMSEEYENYTCNKFSSSWDTILGPLKATKTVKRICL